MPPGSDDDHGSRPHPGPSDRPWFHPSELPLEAEPGAGRRRQARIPVLAALVSTALAAGLIVLALDPISGSDDHKRPAVAGVAPTFVLPASGGRAQVRVPVLEVLGWDGPRVRYGSGVAYSRDGLVVTAASVVAGASTLEVRHAGEHVPATLVGTDPDYDLAVLRVPLRLHPTPFATDRTVAVGDDCFVVGLAPQRRAISVMHGSVAGVDVVRRLAQQWLVGAIEFEAPVASPTAGGALLDDSGKLIGIVTSVRSETAGRPLAVPAAAVVRAVEDLAADGEVAHPWLGLAAREDDEAPGPVVVTVTAGGPAAAAGVVEGDVLTALDGEPVPDLATLIRLVRSLDVGERTVVTIERDGASRNVTVAVAARP